MHNECPIIYIVLLSIQKFSIWLNAEKLYISLLVIKYMQEWRFEFDY